MIGQLQESPYELMEAEIKKLRAKHRKEMLYIKKNMNRKFKMAVKEIEDQAVFELKQQEENHKKAVNRISKSWNIEKQEIENRSMAVEQENFFLKNELNEYKASHDTMIKEIERLKKIIDDLEEENDAYKEHIAGQINYEHQKRENRCEECLQTDNIASIRKSNKEIGVSIKSSMSGGYRQDSFPNLVTLEPNFANKSVYISTARDFEPVHELHTRRSFFDNPIMYKVSVTLTHSQLILSTCPPMNM
jgi:hypothetical protein